MEVIGKGSKFYNNPACIFTCRGCGSDIKARKSEGKYISDWRDGDCIEYKCPECAKKNYVDMSKFNIHE